jgi:hypothetical protein
MNINSLNLHDLLGSLGLGPWRVPGGWHATPPGHDRSCGHTGTSACGSVTAPTGVDTQCSQGTTPAAATPAPAGPDTTNTQDTAGGSAATGTTPTAAGDGTGGATADATNQVLAATAWQQDEQLNLTIQTREGDTVTLYIDRNRSVTNALYATAGADQQSLTLSHSAQSSLDISYSVDGNLSQDELTAIDQLVTGLGKLADKFFSGNVPATLNKVQALGFDNQVLAGFSLQLNYGESRTAIRAYAANAQPASDGTAAAGQSPAPDLNNMGDFIQGLHRLLTDKHLNGMFDTGRVVRDVFQKVADHHGDAHHHGHGHDHVFMNALNGILDGLAQLTQADTAASTDTAQTQSATPDPAS